MSKKNKGKAAAALPAPTALLERTSYSALSLYRTCPQAWKYRYIDRLRRPEDESSPKRDLGTWWQAWRTAEAVHRDRGKAAVALQHTPHTIALPGATLPGDARPEQVLARAEATWQETPQQDKDGFLAQLGASLPERLLVMAERWTARWEQERQHELVLGVEVPWSRAIPGTDMILVGTADEVFLDTRRDMVVVRDNKTSTDIVRASSTDDLMDSQLHLYAWGLYDWLRSHDLAGVRAVSYDRACSVAPKIPVLTLSGTLSKTVTRFDLETYQQWARGEDGAGIPYPGRKADGSGAGVYVEEPAVVEKLSSPQERERWFSRTLVPVNRNIVQAHVLAARDGALGMGRVSEAAARTGQAPRNLGKAACGWCDYASLCRAQMFGGAEAEIDLAEHGLLAGSKR